VSGRLAFGALVVVVVAGCGARTDIDPVGGRRVDVDASVDAAADARPDTRRDAPPSDVGRVDSGPPTPCRADRECLGAARCIADVPFLGDDLAPLPLVCGALLSGAGDGAFCDEAADCDRGLCVVAGTCVSPCVDDEDCAEGARCGRVLARTSLSALQPYDGCVATHDAPDHVRTEIETLTDALSRRPRDLALRTLGTGGPTTWAISAGPDVRLVAHTLRAADGALLFDVDALIPGGPPPDNPLAFGSSLLTVRVPSGRPTTSLGDEFVLRASAGEAADAFVVSFGVDGDTRRVLDVDLYYVGGMGFRRTGDRGPPDVAAGLLAAEVLLGVRIGVVRQHEVVGGTRASLGILEAAPDGDLPELGALFRLSAGAGRPSINIFFVRQAGMALGVSGGIPGPAPMHGTDGSGIAIAADFLGLPEVPSLGRVLAHEIGHHLGLFHTTELQGYVLEPLADTPVCPLSADTDGDGLLVASECAGAGRDNLMFWAASGDELSADQQFVSRRSPVLH
jgi:hypothetical protein